MHASSFLAGLVLPFFAVAAPASSYSYKRLPSSIFARQDNGTNGTCDLASVEQPANTLTAPGADLSLVLIALGRGTQNYSCATSTSTPAAIGAVATLFNASCAVASGTLGSIEEDAASIGAHFFVDSTTPDFDIIGLGNTQAKKVENMTAPNPSADVPWLRLEAQEAGTTSPVRQIYRLNTAGGLAPTNCAGVADGGVVTVDYEAQYWIYASATALKKRKAELMKRYLN